MARDVGACVLKISNTERIYCFELTERQYRKVLARDDRAMSRTERYDVVSGRYSYSGTLLDSLCKVPGVREVSHDPMFGPFVHVRVEEPFEESIQKAKEVLAKYVR